MTDGISEGLSTKELVTENKESISKKTEMCLTGRVKETDHSKALHLNGKVTLRGILKNCLRGGFI